MQEITATILAEKFRWENETADTVILSGVAADNSSLVVKGPHDELGPDVGGTYRFLGRWTSYYNKRAGKEEKQFAYRTCIPAEPQGQRAVVAYLKRCPSITQGIAEQLWEAFGEESVSRLAEGDPLLLNIKRLTDDRIQEAIAWLDDEAAIRTAMVEVIGLLENRGFPASLVRDAVKTGGLRTASIIRRNAYWLMQFRGCGFRRADRLYLDLGGRPDAVKRLVYAAEHAISDMSGDTWIDFSSIANQVSQVVSGMKVDMRRIKRVGQRAKRIALMYTDGRDGPLAMDGDFCWVTSGGRARDERRVARRIKELLGHG